MYNSKQTFKSKEAEELAEAKQRQKEAHKSFKIIRFFYPDDLKNEVVRKGLTKAEAIKHCRKDRTSGIESGRKRKGTLQWFDGFTEQ